MTRRSPGNALPSASRRAGMYLEDSSGLISGSSSAQPDFMKSLNAGDCGRSDRLFTRSLIDWLSPGALLRSSASYSLSLAVITSPIATLLYVVVIESSISNLILVGHMHSWHDCIPGMIVEWKRNSARNVDRLVDMGHTMGATVYCNLLVPVYPDYPSASVFGIPALNSLMRKRLHSMTSVYVKWTISVFQTQYARRFH